MSGEATLARQAPGGGGRAGGANSLVVAHRVCPVLSKTAIGYACKLDLVRDCARSMAAALGRWGGRARVVSILDGCPPVYEETVRDAFSAAPNVALEILETPAAGNQATYAKQIEVLHAAQDADFVYFSEDDYAYHPDAFLAMADFLRRPGVDFVTPLDHPDRYNHALGSPRPSAIRVSSYCHWRSVGTTCLTFMTTRAVFRQAERLLSTYGAGAMDGTMWLGLTKEDVFRPGAVLPPVLAFLLRRKRPFGFYMPLCAWKHHGLRLLTSPRYTLWQPMPTLAVHVSSSTLPLHAAETLPGAEDSLRAQVLAAERNTSTWGSGAGRRTMAACFPRCIVQKALALFRVFGLDLYERRLRAAPAQALGRLARRAKTFRDDGLGLFFDFSALHSHAQVGRDFLARISQTSIPFCVADSHVPGTSDARIPAEESSFARRLAGRPFDQRKVLHFASTRVAGSRDYSVAATPFWEFEDGLAEARPDFFKGCGSAVVFSTFCREAVERIAPPGFAVRQLRYPIPLSERRVDRAAVRARFHIPDEAFAVFFNFNIESGFDRKNPLGAIEAFARAFPRDPGACLVFKVSGCAGQEGKVEEMCRCALRRGLGGRLLLVRESLVHGDVLDLTGSCDAYLSLHRGEGLGLGMLEAMSAQVPVVATAYGGNMDFTREDTAFLVPYGLVPAKTDFAPYRHVGKWADPDLDAAAAHLRTIRERPAAVKDRVAGAKRAMEDYCSLENFEKDVRGLIAAWGKR